MKMAASVVKLYLFYACVHYDHVIVERFARLFLVADVLVSPQELFPFLVRGMRYFFCPELTPTRDMVLAAYPKPKHKRKLLEK